jgi:hypothetical protein
MKKVILISGFALISFFSNAQIAEVKEEDRYAKIYNENGKYQTSIFMDRDGFLAGYNSRFVVIVDDKYAKIYNENGKYQASIFMDKDCKVQNVSGSNIIIKEGNRTKFYDFNGKYVRSN